MKDCRKCSSIRGCAGKEWFHYGEVRWCVFQVLWILEHSEELGSGDSWPPAPDGSSYIDPKIRTGYPSEANYAKPVAILAEVKRRLKKTGIHGKLLRSEVKAGETMETMEPEARDALWYTAGWEKKDLSFSAWKKQRNYRKKGEG